MLNGEMQSNHPDLLQSPTLVVGEKKEVKPDSKLVSKHASVYTQVM